MFKVVFVVLILIMCTISDPILPSIAARLKKVNFVYPNNIQSERDLFICPENSVCNIIHKRFWLPPIVERLCKCSQRRECIWTWSDNADNHTMTLDNRSQMKFCSDISELPVCGLKKTAIKTVTQSSEKKINTPLSFKGRNFQKTNLHTEHRNVTGFCSCPNPHYWKVKANSTKYDEETNRIQQSYICSKLKKCSKMEFCGFVRTDTYSTFYRCSCPKGHLCITKDKTAFKVEEMLFTGYGYKAFCFPVKNSTTQM